MFGKLTDKIVYNQLTHYVVLASCMVRGMERRQALKELIDLIFSKQGESVLFFNREDSRYFVAEFDGVRLMTVYEDRNGDISVEAIDRLPESGASIITEMLAKAIQIKTLEWHVAALDRIAGMHQRTVAQLGNISKLLTVGNNFSQANLPPPAGPLY
jgi:hypothetical protein